MDIFNHIIEKAKIAKTASSKMAVIESKVKDEALKAMAEAVLENEKTIIAANAEDIKKAPEFGLSDAMIDRLSLTHARIEAMAKGINEVASLPDPVGKISDMVKRPSGIRVGRMTVPIGLIGFIYESRPNVTADATALTLKSGNSVLLRGGKEAINSNICIANILSKAAVSKGIPEGTISIVEMTDRDGVKHLAQAEGLVDLIIPRGGKGLIKTVVEFAKVPVIKHYDGNCHVYVDKSADMEKALTVVMNAKTQRPGVCNATETLLVHRDISFEFLPKAAKLLIEKGVELRGCGRSRALVPSMKPAEEEDWYAEYLDLILAVRIVDSLEEAVGHINHYSSHHTDAIMTNDVLSADYFVTSVDSSSVMVNASTRFSDGGEYGLGAEVGISTDKLHARGPMGVEGLTTYKWVVYGDGSIRK